MWVNTTYAQQTKDVLFVGNSYTYVNNLPSMLSSLASSGNNILLHDENTIGGYTLQQHLINTNTINKIQSKSWDYVILQEQSLKPALNPFAFISSTNAVTNDLIRQTDKCASVMYFMTWARRNPITQCVGCGFNTFDEMQESITSAYKMAADQTFGEISPVGIAWQNVINSGSSINLYNGDGSHPSTAGTYLSACVFYAAIFKESPVGLSFYATLPTNEATFLQQMAESAYLEYDSAGYINQDIVPFELKILNANNDLEAGTICSLPKKLSTRLEFQFTGHDTTSSFTLLSTVKRAIDSSIVTEDTILIEGINTCLDTLITLSPQLKITEFGDFLIEQTLLDSQDRTDENNKRRFAINNPGLQVNLTQQGDLYLESFEDDPLSLANFWLRDEPAGAVGIGIDTTGLKLPVTPDGSKVSYLWQIFEEGHNWLFSPCLVLEENHSYQIDFYYANSSFFLDSIDLALYIGRTPSKENMNVLIQDYSPLYEPSFVHSSNVFVADQSNVMSLGWQTSFVSNTSMLAIDSFRITNLGEAVTSVADSTKSLLLTIFPNPAFDKVKIQAPKEMVDNIFIYNSSGVLVYEKVNFTIDDSIHTKNWNTGIYIVKCKIKDKIITSRFVVQ